MEVNKLNSLVELFFEKLNKINKEKPFLKWLKPNKSTYTWYQVSEKIFKLTNKIKSIIKEGDRCLILSENRPYWLMSDIAIMNAGGISVPIFTTYSSNDYKYILNDCKPTIIIVSNNDQFKKIKNFLNPEIKEIISFEELDHKSLLIDKILKEETDTKIINKNLKKIKIFDAARKELPEKICKLSKEGDQLMIEVERIWLGAYASLLGDVALQELCFGGLWISGGTASKHFKNFKSDLFLKQFFDKGRLKDILKTIPMKVILDEEFGLLSAACRAKMLLKNQ